MASNGEILKQIVTEVTPRLEVIPAPVANDKPDPAKWSKQEILGHLIDSANHNHRRFVAAVLQDDLVFDGYDQDQWVAVQRYQDAEWAWIIQFWRAYNLRLAEIIDQLPEYQLTRARETHNLNRIAWKTVPVDRPVTLDYLIKDYIVHLEHHLRQILNDYQPVMSD